MKLQKTLLAAAVAAMLVPNAQAGEKEELLKLKGTTLNLIEALVNEGILSRERADEIVRQAEQSASETVQRAEREQAAPRKEIVRVPYVPEFVKEEIRDEVRAELREDVVNDVMQQAETQRWGVPNALPDWTRRFSFKGDIRLRAQSDLYSSDNITPEDFLTYIDWNESNDAGKLCQLNTVDDRYRGRVRLRLGVDAKVTTNLKAGIRLTSGNTNDPVSTNQTLGNYNNKYQVVLDRAYLKYDGYDVDGNRWLTLYGGRIPNPWFSTDLVWDKDLSFEGVAAKFDYKLGASNSLYDIDESNRKLFMTLGAFPLEEEEFSSRDKWLFGAQIGSEFNFQDQSRFVFGVAYYDYQNIEGKRNAVDSNTRDFTAPEFTQKGNTMFAISNSAGVQDFSRFALAAEYKLLNITAHYDLARFAPMHLMVDAGYGKNIGYGGGDTRDRAEGTPLFCGGSVFTCDPNDDPTEGYYVKLTAGWPNVLLPRRWQMSLGYKYLEGDAVLDAFTDSDFHLGGTNAKGWILGGNYGLMPNTWISARWMSADEVDGPPLGIDVLQLDLNAKF